MRRFCVAAVLGLLLALSAVGVASATHLQDCATRDGSVVSGRVECRPHQ